MHSITCDWCDGTAAYSLGLPTTATVHMCGDCKSNIKESVCLCGTILFIRNYYDPALDVGLCHCCYDTITPLPPEE